MDFLVLPTTSNFAPSDCLPLTNIRVEISFPNSLGLFEVCVMFIETGIIYATTSDLTEAQAVSVATVLYHSLWFAD
jgi:hypothetical protein